VILLRLTDRPNDGFAVANKPNRILDFEYFVRLNGGVAE
jgi:hypothetical protein